MKGSEWEMKEEKQNKWDQNCVGRAVKTFRYFFFFFPPSVCMGMSGNHSGRASTGVLGLFTPVKDIGNMKSSDSDQKSEFQLLACFKNILVYL